MTEAGDSLRLIKQVGCTFWEDLKGMCPEWTAKWCQCKYMHKVAKHVLQNGKLKLMKVAVDLQRHPLGKDKCLQVKLS
jgi:hypothetical protein